MTSLLFLGIVVIPVAMSNAASGDMPASAATNNIAETNASALPPLERKISLKAQKMPLKEVLAEMCRQAKIELELDVDGLKLSGVSMDMLVTMECKDEPLQSVFVRIYRLLERRGSFGDFYPEIRNGKLLVTSLKGRNARETQWLPDWLKPLNENGVVSHFDDQTNVISISVGAKADDDFLAKLKTLPKLQELDIEVTKFITPQGLAQLGDLPALEKLSLYHVNGGSFGLGDAAMKAVSKIRTLRDLSVKESGVTDDGVRALEGMTQLTALTLSGNGVTDAGMKYLAGLTNLQQLDLSQTAWVQSHMQITDKGLKDLSNLTALWDLSIGGLANVTDAALKHLSRLTELRNFSFAGSSVTSQSINFPKLESLDFSGEQVTDATLSNIDQHRDLQKLTLRYTAATDATMGRIAKLTELRRLTIDSYYITDAGIGQLRALPKLEHLELRATQVSDASLRSLAEIKSLKRIDLNGSGVPGVNFGQLFTMDGLQQLKNLPNLRELWINNLELPEGCLGLRELKQLRSLDLDFCNVKDAEEELLKTLMPDTYVSAVSGNFKIFPAAKTNEPVLLPDISVRVTGRAVDDATGLPVNDCTLEFGADNPDKPGEVIWGESLPGDRMEVAGTIPHDKSGFWGESFRPGKVWLRLLAGGHQPALVTPNPVVAPLRLTNLVVRLKHGGDYHGVVLDYLGHPVPGIHVYLADKPRFLMNDGVERYSNNTGFSTTDTSGRFSLPGGNGTRQKIVAATADGHLFQVVPDADSSQNLKVTLPQPATIIIRYDIPDDIPKAEFGLSFRSETLEPATWTNTSFGVSSSARNGNEVTLTNLLPGPYELMRSKTLNVGKGSRFGFLNWTNLVLKPGKTKRVEFGCPVGQTVRGQVTGITEASAFGAYIYAFADHATNTTANWWQHQQPDDTFDMVACGADGHFQTARLPPGAYNLVAMAFTEPRVYSHNMDPEYFGVAKVTVIADAPTPPIKITLIPCTEANRMASK